MRLYVDIPNKGRRYNMGQRLNIEIQKNGEVLANAYYHWSAYTGNALELTQQILNEINKGRKYEDEVINAVKLLEVTGAGLTDKEKEFARNNIKNYNSYQFAPCRGRNEGLISISKSGIKETRYWEEGRVEIDISKNIINFKVIWEYSKNEFEINHENKKYEQLPIYDIQFMQISFEAFTEFKDTIMDLLNNKIYYIRCKNDNDTVYVFVA